jgi:hypothetical protein
MSNVVGGAESASAIRAVGRGWVRAAFAQAEGGVQAQFIRSI